jgi:esterase/lipase superfamily enzyme
MNITNIRDRFNKEFPREFCTLSASSVYLVNIDDERMVITVNGSIYYVDLEQFYLLLVEVISNRSFENELYKGRFYKLPYLLPIVKFFIIQTDYDLREYTPPKSGWKEVDISLIKDKNKNHSIGTTDESSYSDKAEGYLKSVLKMEEHLQYKEITNDQIAVSDVYYATNRKRSNEDEFYSGDIDLDVHYGRASVTIPKVIHKSGDIERPLSFWKFSLKGNEKKHFMIKSVSEVKKNTFLSSVRQESQGKSITIFIHGFNVTFKDAIFKAAQIKYDLGYQYPLILFSWPSKGKVLSYMYDSRRAKSSSSKLYELLEDIYAMGVADVNVIAHSMGTFCLAEAIKGDNKSITPVFSRLALAAPDIDVHDYKSVYADIFVKTFKNISLYVSATDKALLLSELMNQIDRLGSTKNEIVVRDGIDTIDMSNSDNGLFTLKHSYISEENNALNDLHQFLINKIPVKNRRLQSLFNENKQEYWSLRK